MNNMGASKNLKKQLVNFKVAEKYIFNITSQITIKSQQENILFIVFYFDPYFSVTTITCWKRSGTVMTKGLVLNVAMPKVIVMSSPFLYVHMSKQLELE